MQGKNGVAPKFLGVRKLGCRSRSAGPQGGLFCQETWKLTCHHYPILSIYVTASRNKNKCVGPTTSFRIQLDAFSHNQLWKTNNGFFPLTHQLHPATTVGVCKPLFACLQEENSSALPVWNLAGLQVLLETGYLIFFRGTKGIHTLGGSREGIRAIRIHGGNCRNVVCECNV